MPDALFTHKKPIGEKLLTFGFHKEADSFIYATNIVNGQFVLHILIDAAGIVKTDVIDASSGEEYVLHKVPGASGAFVGAVRAEYEGVLQKICEACFEPDIFKSDYAKAVIQHIGSSYRCEPEFLWPRFPTNAIFRRKDTGKWYGALLVLSKRKLGIDSDEVIEILDLRIEPEKIDAIVDGKKYFPGYHMNKKHWITICLDGSVPMEEIFERINASYILAV